jgi:protein-tyrosine phosphatase
VSPGTRGTHDPAATTGSQETIPLDIIIVCTANMGRSPLFAVALQAQADRRLGPGAVTIGSAGIDAPSGAPAAEGARRVAAEWGLSLNAHRARSTRFAPMDEAALILTMTRRQKRILTRERSERADRTFVLREAVPALGAIADPNEAASDATCPRERVQAVVATANDLRPSTRLRSRYDVPDPAGGDNTVYAALGAEFADAAQRLAAVLFGPGRG